MLTDYHFFYLQSYCLAFGEVMLKVGKHLKVVITTRCPTSWTIRKPLNPSEWPGDGSLTPLAVS